MNKQPATPCFIFRLISVCRICLLIGAGISTATAASNPDYCALLKPSDVAPLLGGKVSSKSSAGGCVWSGSGSNKKLDFLSYRAIPGVSFEMVYKASRQQGIEDGELKFTDESGIGDKAFSVVDQSGLIAIMMMRKGRYFQMQYVIKAAPTAKDLAALKSVAKKAAAAM